MLDSLERLLILQDRDQKITYLNTELTYLDPQRRSAQHKARSAQETLDASRLKVRHLESERKRLELEVDSKKQQIERYALQQYETRKNEEYRALAHEIELARKAIVSLEDQQLELMEQGEAAEKAAKAAAKQAEETRQESDRRLKELDAREKNLHEELAHLGTDRADLAAQVPADVLSRYERLRRSKGERVVVGVDHGVCGGCHMRLPAHVLILCQTEQDLVHCPNCGRILYYTRDMNLASADK